MTQALSSIQNYCDAVNNTLAHWLAIHTDANAWYESYISPFGGVRALFEEAKGELGNSVFLFDWKAAAYRQMAKEYLADFHKCPNCNAVYPIEMGLRFGECENCEEVEEDDFGDAELEDLEEYFSDCDYTPDDHMLEASLIQEGFTQYYDSIKANLSSILDDVSDTLDRIRHANSNEELLVAVLYGTNVYHSSGNIMKDYSDYVTDLEYNHVDTIRNEGLEAFFSMEELREFLEE